jgi:aminoglycoside phosphotransferase (APT) family kinase protein
MDAFPHSKTYSVSGLQCVGGGLNSQVYSFFLSYVSKGLKQRKSFVLKLYEEKAKKEALKEFKMLRILKEYSFTVPTVYPFEHNTHLMGKSFIVMEKLGGANGESFFNDEANALLFIRKMADKLSILHNLRLSGIYESTTLQKEYESSIQDMLDVMKLVGKRPSGLYAFSSIRQKLFAAAEKRIGELAFKKFQSTLIHMDYAPCHIIVSDSSCGVIDWADATIGDPSYDVALAYHYLRIGKVGNIDFGEYFVEQYKKYSGQRLDNLESCKDITVVKLALWSDLYPNYSKELMPFWNFFDQFVAGASMKLLGDLSVRRHQRWITQTQYHNQSLRSIDSVQRYVLKFLKKDRYYSIIS